MADKKKKPVRIETVPADSVVMTTKVDRIGKIVRFHTGSNEQAAMIVKENSDGTVNLRVFGPDGKSAYSKKYAKTGTKPGEWS